MATGDKHVDIYNKQLLPQQGWDQYFFKYLDDKINAATRSAFLTSGVLSDKDIGLTSTANDTFSADITDASRGVDDDGNVMDLANLSTDEYEEIAFENASGVAYYVGFRYQGIPSGIERNPRSSEPEYPYELDSIGELGEPDSVTDNTSYIRLVLDGILESSVDHSGRLVTVWLDNPVSPVESIAYWNGTVQYSTVNYVDIPYTPTAGPLGQTAPTYPISTTASDYRVHVKGLSWFRNTDISIDGTYVYLGIVQGSGAGTTPTVFDISTQNKAFLISLQRAYYGNSTDDPAPGRTIWAHRKAVKIRQSASTAYEQDYANAALWLDKQDEGVVVSVSNLNLWFNSSAFLFHDINVRSLNDGVGNDLQAIEAATISGSTITLTRPGVDLTTFAEWWLLDPWVQVENTTNNLYDGMYFVGGAVTTNTIPVLDFDLGAPSFPSDTCQIRVFIPQWAHYFSDPHGSTFNDIGRTMKVVPKIGNGFDLAMGGQAVSPNESTFLRARNVEGAGSSVWFSLFSGRTVMAGGGSLLNGQRYFDSDVVGSAQYRSDKRTTTNLQTNYQVDEGENEWGYDYRGTDFGNYSSTDAPGYQVAASFRQPLTSYDGGAVPLQSEEPFSSTTVDTLNFTRGSFSGYYIPAYSSGGRSWVMAEIQFDTPHASDGVYLVYSKPTGTTVTFKTFDGSTPSFPVSQTGVARFYGGAFFGTTNAATYGGNSGWIQTIAAATPLTGCLRMIFDGEDDIASTNYRYGTLIQGYADSMQMWGVRDGGIMYARAITTRNYQAGHELTQWDEVDSALVNTDHAVADLYTGTLSQITQYDLTEGTRYISIPSTLTDCNVVGQLGGGSWTSVTKHINIFKIISDQNTGYPTWFQGPAGASYITNGYGDDNGAIGFYVPQGATLTAIEIYVDPVTGDGTAASFGVDVLRKGFADTTGTSLRSSGMQWAASATAHTMTITLDQNNTIDNSSYTYWVRILGSGSAGDKVYTARGLYTILRLGENWFDCF